MATFVMSRYRVRVGSYFIRNYGTKECPDWATTYIWSAFDTKQEAIEAIELARNSCDLLKTIKPNIEKCF